MLPFVQILMAIHVDASRHATPPAPAPDVTHSVLVIPGHSACLHTTLDLFQALLLVIVFTKAGNTIANACTNSCTDRSTNCSTNRTTQRCAYSSSNISAPSCPGGRILACRICIANGISIGVEIGIQPTFKSNRITLDVPPSARVVVSEVVVE